VRTIRRISVSGQATVPRYEGVYQGSRGGWYYKAWSGYDPLTGKKNQTTQRAFATAADAARARKVYLADVGAGRRPASRPGRP
jgi:hypothetical protein